MKKIFTLTLLLGITMMVSAQNARAILDKASDTYNKAGSITATFTLDAKDTKAKQTYSYDGKAYMKGDKFKIEIPDAITWFDGKDQWTLRDDEVSINTPTKEELQGISPSVIFGIYKKGFKLSYKGEKKVGAKTVQEVELVPEKKGIEFTKMRVEIDKATSMFHRIIVYDKSGIENMLTIRNYKTGVSLGDDTFRFSKKDYPMVEVYDLRNE